MSHKAYLRFSIRETLLRRDGDFPHKSVQLQKSMRTAQSGASSQLRRVLV